MIRAGLLLYLIFATAAGPGLCCCLADGFGSLASKEKSAKSCCPKHNHDKKEGPAKSPSGPCPCQEDRVSPNPGWAAERIDFFEAPSVPFECVLGILPSQLILTDWQTVGPEDTDANEVRRHMTADPVKVSPNTPVKVLAKRMIDARIHRIIVVDDLERPIGVVSSIDILAVVAIGYKAAP